MKKAAMVFLGFVLLAGACDLETTGGARRGNGLGGFGGGRAEARAELRVEARRERLREQRLARIERRREARLAALRRERREQQRKQAAAAAAAAAAPEPVENCTDGYDPCLPPAADYDCENGTGDGPAYTGYVSVTGFDPYDLDADGDGVGCES